MLARVMDSLSQTTYGRNNGVASETTSRYDPRVKGASQDEIMKKRLAYVAFFLAFLPLAGCATGDAWYYPYGPSYSEEEPAPQSVKQFLSQPRTR